jgi:LPS-assembly protein
MRCPPLLLCSCLALLSCTPAAGQVPGFNVSKQFRLERLGEDHWRATGQVEMEREDMRFFADVVDFHTSTHRLEASGNVVFTSADTRIAADRVEFDTLARTGTFHNASGSVSLGDRVDRSMFGTQEPDAYFYGETLEKLGPAKYRITRGGFTTCVQPTPRWEVVGSTVTVTLDEYAVLRNSVLKVKGVPVFYLPILYYPIQDDDRATGFLIPSFGSSTIRGTSLSNAFFWAIDRSQDATFFHDWFARTGQGTGGEYRYIAAPGSDGHVRTYWLNERATSYASATGTVDVPARRSYEIRANAQQVLPWSLRARANVDYFSDITVQQTYQGNLYDASRRQRLFGANLSRAWGANRVSFTLNRNEIFYGATDSQVYGSAPRLTFDRAQRRIGRIPLYYALGGEYVGILRTTKFNAGEIAQGLTRVDVRPVLSAPFTRWPFLSVNATAAWNSTWYSESLDENGVRVTDPLLRTFVDLRADVVGPTLARVWDTPGNGYAEKFKHVVEPTFSVQRTSVIDDYDRIAKLDAMDYVLGGTTRVSYGVTNRLLARRTGVRQPREVVNVSVVQSYYSDDRASQVDPSYGSSFAGRPASNYSPIAINARVSPTDEINGAIRLEYDYQLRLLQTVRANGTYALRDQLHVTGGWSQRKTNIFDVDRPLVDNYINLGTTVKTLAGRVGGSYGFDYDLGRDTLLQQRLMLYYNAQCCGVAVEYQKYNFPRLDPRFPVAADRRINISFTLAGIGTFSNLLGAFGGNTPGRGY